MQRSVTSILAAASIVAGLAISMVPVVGSGAGFAALPDATADAVPAGAPPIGPPSGALPTVIGARLGIHPDKTRFVLELSQRVAFHTQALTNPNRVVIELPDLAWPGAETTHAGTGLIRSYHVERPGAGSLRLVLSAAGPVRVANAMLMTPSEGHQNRLVIDLAAGAAPASAAATTAAASPPIHTDSSPPPVAVASPPPPPPAPYVPPAPVAATPPAPTPLPPPSQAADAPPAAYPPPPAASPPAASPPIQLLAPARQPSMLSGVPRSSAMPMPPPTPPAPPTPPSRPSPHYAAAMPPPAHAHRPAVGAKPMVALDPGHGGVDPGATGINGIHEKDLTLATAREVQRQLEATGRYRVMLTRDDDEFVPLRERVARAREAGANLFISLHADSISRPEIRGLSIYTLSDKASDHEAESLAAKENRSDAIGGIDLSHENDQVATILIDLAQRDTRNHSKHFATLVLHEAGHTIALLPKPDRSAGFAVLTAPDVPSVLIEMGYLSSVEDCALLTQTTHRQHLAASLVHAVDGYFNWLSGGRRS